MNTQNGKNENDEVLEALKERMLDPETVAKVARGSEEDREEFLMIADRNGMAKEARILLEKALNDNEKENKRDLSKLDFPIRALFSLKDLMEKEIPDPSIFVGDVHTPLLSEGTTVLAAPPKLGKSWFCACLGIALTTESPFLGMPTKKCHVLYCDLEQSERIKQKRIRMIIEEMNIDVPEGFYIRDELQGINRGFKEQIEHDLASDPLIGVIIIDVFSYIETARKNTETEYQWTYKNFSIINEIAKIHHIAFILVLHTRKLHDPDHPFDNILGSTANQGASSHMIVLAKNKTSDSTIHLYAQGRETEGMIELEYVNKRGILTVVEGAPEEADELSEFLESEIRDAIVKLMGKTDRWKGRCSGLIEECSRQSIGIDAAPKEIGIFLGKHTGRFMKHDRIMVNIIKNGNAPRIYEIVNRKNDKSTIDTIDGWQMTIDENPFVM